MTDIRQSYEYANYVKSSGWNYSLTEGNFVFIRKIPFLGNIVKIQRPKTITPNFLKKIKADYNPLFTIIEPKSKNHARLLRQNGFRLSNGPYSPSKTLMLDLTNKRSNLIAGMKTDARSALNKTTKLRIIQVSDLDKFRSNWKNSVGLKRYVPPLTSLYSLKRSFPTSLFLASHNYSSGAIFLLANTSASYWQAFTNEDGRATLAQYKIVWNGILWAKRNKAKYFDFEGIYDTRFPDKKWLGFSHFKKSFGGIIETYPGTYTSNFFKYLKIFK